MPYQWISRLLGNAHIDVEAVMAPYAREVLARACAGSRTLVVIIPEQGQRRPSQGDGVAARGRACPAFGLVHEEVARRHRLSRAARGLGDGRRPGQVEDERGQVSRTGSTGTTDR